MTTFIIGDIQGCYAPFRRLLDKVKFDPAQDRLWVTGDIVNRGHESLAVLRELYTMRASLIGVLGNHDLTLLAVAAGVQPFHHDKHTFQDVLDAPDREALLNWLNSWPMVYHDLATQSLMVHAGLVPGWDLNLILSLSEEIQQCLQGTDRQSFLEHLYGNEPEQWSPALSSWPRWRFIVNAFTRIRFCTPEGHLDMITKEGKHKAPQGYQPWFEVVPLPKGIQRIFFGHWAALEGHTGHDHIIGLDTGCVWGKCLTAYVLEEGRVVQESCSI